MLLVRTFINLNYPAEHHSQMFIHVVLSRIRSGVTLLLTLQGVHAGGGGVATDLHMLVPHILQTLVHKTETNSGLVGKAGTHRDGTVNISQIKFRAKVILTNI